MSLRRTTNANRRGPATGPRSVLAVANFTMFSSGEAPAALGAGLAVTSDADRTVQTADDTLVTGISANRGRIGRLASTDVLGLVIEGASTNAAAGLDAWDTLDVTRMGSIADPAGGTGAYQIEDASAAALGTLREILSQTTEYRYTVWAKKVSGSDPTILFSTSLGVSTVSASAWARYSAVGRDAGSGGDNQMLVRPGGNTVAGVGACDVFMATVHTGAIHIEALPGAASVAADELSTSSAASWIDGGRLSLALRFRPRGDRGDYSAIPLWYVDANNSATLNPSTGHVTVTIGGSGITTSGTALAFSAGDTVDLWIAAGGGAATTEVKARVNDGSTVTVGTGSAQGSLSATDLSVLSDGTDTTNAHVETIAAYRAGKAPAWAA